MYDWKAYVPVIQGFRSPARLIVLTHLALALSVAVGFAELRRFIRSGERCSWVSLLSLAVLPVISWFVVAAVCVLRGIPDSAAGEFAVTQITSARSAAVGAAIVSVAAALVALAVRGNSWALPALLVFAVIDMGYTVFATKNV